MITYTINEQRVATICFNRDDKRNAFNEAMAQQLLRSLEQADRDQARAAILRANAGVSVWCAGHDLAELDPQHLHVENPTLEVAREIQLVTFPVIAMVEGRVYGGGLILLLSADIVVATENSNVAIASNKLGIPLSPELHAYWLRVMGIHKTKELLFTGATVSAKDAYDAGLYNHVVKQQELEPVTNEIAKRITECSPAALAITKQQLNQIAQQAGLPDEERVRVTKRNAEILNSQDTKNRIATLLASLRCS